MASQVEGDGSPSRDPSHEGGNQGKNRSSLHL
jgi:hypothetical protein